MLLSSLYDAITQQNTNLEYAGKKQVLVPANDCCRPVEFQPKLTSNPKMIGYLLSYVLKIAVLTRLAK